MVNFRNDHEMIARILNGRTISSYEEWTAHVFTSIVPFYESLDALILSRTKGLKKGSPYRWNASNEKDRQCMTKQRWNFSHPKMPYKRDGVAAFVQLGDYETGGDNVILWGISWWGSKKDSVRMRDLFTKIKGSSELDDRISKIGATGTFLRVILKKYRVPDILGRRGDIKKEIAKDIVGIVNRISTFLS